MTTSDEYVQMVMQARMDRLDAEATALLAAGHSFDDIVVVTSPMWPDSKVVTVAEMEQHERDLRDGVAPPAKPIEGMWRYA